MRVKQTIGNRELWQREKTLFLTSRMTPIGCYEKVFRWVEEFDKRQCAVCFNSSEFENEVLKALLVWRVPTALVVLNKFSDRYNVQIERALKENRLLILVLQPEESDGKGHVLPDKLLEQILSLYPKPKRIKDKHPNHGAPWRKEDDERLTELHKSGTAVPDLMTFFGRSYRGITSRLRKLNLI